MGTLICVSGNLGSGKSTIARLLANGFGFALLPEKPDETYVEDLFSRPSRWSFEAQMAFLANKAAALERFRRDNLNAVLDRSIYEDVEIFGRYFAEEGWMDPRAFETYQSYAELLMSRFSPPSLLVYCECPSEVCEARVSQRPRPYQRLYPDGHIKHLGDRYKAWIGSFSGCPVLRIDTEEIDARTRQGAESVMSLTRQAMSADAEIEQARLFTPGLRTKRDSGQPSDQRARESPSLGKWGGTPTVYVAAPFTTMASEKVSKRPSKLRLVDVEDSHGVLPEGPYRNILRRIVEALRSRGYSALLPHRDINRWGRKHLSPKDVALQCLHHVRRCDLFLGILSTSYGAHVEAATALALRKPAILVNVAAEGESFMAQAVRQSGLAATVSVREMKDLPRLIRDPAFDDIVETAVQAARLPSYELGMR